MISIAPVRILFLVVSFILVNHSSQQEFFEDAVKRETLSPELDTSLLSNIDENDTEEPYLEYNGPPNIPARDDEPEPAEEQEQEDEDAGRRAGNSIDGNADRMFLQEAPAFNEEEEKDEDVDDEDGKTPYNDEEREIDENAKKRSELEKFEQNADTSKKITKPKKLESIHKNHNVKTSHDQEKARKRSTVKKRNTKKVGAKDSANKVEKSKSKEEEDSSVSGSSSGEGSVGSGNVASGDEESSGAERERRQAFQTEDQVMKAKEKLKNAQEASEALTSIEREMGLDPSVAPDKTKNLTSALHSEMQKFKDIITSQNDEVKKSKFQKLEKLAEEDVKGANDVMKLIVELEVAKFFAKNRARKKLELALRNKITTPPSPPEPAAPVVPWFGGMGQYQNQAGMADFMPAKEQSFNAPNPYASYADEPQQPAQQAQAMSFPSAPQAAFQPFPMPPAPFQPAPLPSVPFQPFNAPAVQNPLQGQYQDGTLPPQRWNPQVASFAPVPQEYNPYVANPMSFAPVNAMPQPNPQLQQQPGLINNPPMSKPAHKIVKVAPKHKITEKKPQKPAQRQDNRPQIQSPHQQNQQAKYLPQSSPFSGLQPLQSLSPVQQQLPSYSNEMQLQKAPFSSYTQTPFAASSSHPYSDAFAPPPPQPNTQAFYPQSSWASPPPQINRFSDSLSHLNPHYQKPAATFKPVSSKPPVKAGQRPHPPDLAKMLKDLARYHSRPITAHHFRPVPAVQSPEPQQLHEPSPPALQTPPMYSQFDFPGQPEPAIPVRQPATQFAPPNQQYYQPQVPQVPFVNPQPPMPAPLPIQYRDPPMQFSNEQKNNDADEDEEEDVNPMDQQFNDNPNPQQTGLQYQGQAVYPQQQQQMPQAYSGYNSWTNPAISGNMDSLSWPQNPNPLVYGYQPETSYEQAVDPIITEALNKVHDTKKAASVVQRIENTIGLSPPAVNHIINDVESETKKEKMQFDQDVKNDEDEIQKDKTLINNDESTNKEDLQKKIKEKKKKLDEDKKRDEIAKNKLATIEKIEKILTIIETAKYSALERAKAHLMKLKTEKDPQIRKRDLETLENDLKKSEENHLHRRNEINIWLKGSRNNINTSHFLEGKRKDIKDHKKNYNVFGAPSIPKLAIARFSTRVAKKSKIDSPANFTARASEASKEKPAKKPKIGIILMRKLLQRMDDLYDMQSKILTQLIKDHQRVKDEKENDRSKRNIHSAHHRHQRHANHRHHRHRRHHSR